MSSIGAKVPFGLNSSVVPSASPTARPTRHPTQRSTSLRMAAFALPAGNAFFERIVHRERIIVSFFNAPGGVVRYVDGDRTIWSMLNPSSRV